MDYVLTTCLHLCPLLLEIIQHIASVIHLITNTYAQILSSVVLQFLSSFSSTRLEWTTSYYYVFKRSLNSTLIGVPLFYLDGKRISQIYHSRLRMDCSSLNHHLFKKTSLTVRFASVVDQKLPNTACLIVIDLITWARKWCNHYLNYANQPWMPIYTEPQICPTRRIGSISSSYRSIY